MTTKIKPVKAWAVVDPEGKILGGAVSGYKSVCISRFTHSLYSESDENPWISAQKQGYRCIPVTITPEGE